MSATLTVDAETLKPLIHEIVIAVLAEVHQVGLDGERLAYSEVEAAKLLGLRQHQLRDQRLAGRISCSKGPKNSPLYSKADLLRYLASRREAAR